MEVDMEPKALFMLCVLVFLLLLPRYTFIGSLRYFYLPILSMLLQVKITAEIRHRSYMESIVNSSNIWQNLETCKEPYW